MTTVTFHVGDVRDVMATMADDSVNLVVTSPPFLALRSYLPADHPDKAREIGSEPTPAAYLDTMLELTQEWRRLLTPTGSLCVEIGDTYSGAGGYGSPDSINPAYDAERFAERWEGRTAKRFKTKDDGWPLAKSLCGIPTLYCWSLAYGHNLLNPATRFDPWRFAGSGTTAVAAAQLGRNAILIDLDERNIDLCRRRLHETVRILSEVRDGDTWTWTVEPATRQQVEAQQAGQTELWDNAV